MKVLHFFKTYYPDSFGGIEQFIYQLAEGGPKVGVSAQVLSLSRRGSFYNIPFGNHLTHSAYLNLYYASTGFSISAFKRFKFLANQVDIIHYHFPWPFMDLVHFATRLRKPCVLTYQSDIIKQKGLFQIYKPLMYRFMQSVDHIVATSPNYLASSAVLQRFKHKVSVIPIGLDPSLYPLASAQRLEKWQAIVGRRFFLFIGAIRYYKGLPILLQALSGIDLPMVIIGSGPNEMQLKRQATQMGLKNIHFLGGLDDVDKQALLELCYAVVFPSHLRSEAFGISLLEGALYAKPLISTEIGTGTSYINIDQRTGIVVPPADPNALRQAMLKLWHNPHLAAYYGLQAKQRYESHFTANQMLSSYANLYRQILKLH